MIWEDDWREFTEHTISVCVTGTSCPALKTLISRFAGPSTAFASSSSSPEKTALSVLPSTMDTLPVHRPWCSAASADWDFAVAVDGPTFAAALCASDRMPMSFQRLYYPLTGAYTKLLKSAGTKPTCQFICQTSIWIRSRDSMEIARLAWLQSVASGEH